MKKIKVNEVQCICGTYLKPSIPKLKHGFLVLNTPKCPMCGVDEYLSLVVCRWGEFTVEKLGELLREMK